MMLETQFLLSGVRSCDGGESGFGEVKEYALTVVLIRGDAPQLSLRGRRADYLLCRSSKKQHVLL